MVYYTGPNKKVKRLSKDSSPTFTPNSTPTPTSSSSKKLSTPIIILLCILGAIAIGVGILMFRSWMNRKNEQVRGGSYDIQSYNTPPGSPFFKR